MIKSKITKQLALSIVSIVLVGICLTVTTFAIVYSMVSVESNLFRTGTVDIELKPLKGEKIIEEGEFLFEPGATVKKEFSVINNSTCEVYYKVYFEFEKHLGSEKLEDTLAEFLEVWICDESGKELVRGKPSELIRSKVSAFDGELGIGETKKLEIYFHFPEDSGNLAQGRSFSFDLVAEAVQTKNNPEKIFD